jgi:hypothetical protein
MATYLPDCCSLSVSLALIWRFKMKLMWFIAGVGVGPTVSLFIAPTTGERSVK